MHWVNAVVMLTALAGSAQTVAARIAALRDELGITRISLRPSFWGSCPAAVQEATVARFATDVMPHFR